MKRTSKNPEAALRKAWNTDRKPRRRASSERTYEDRRLTDVERAVLLERDRLREVNAELVAALEQIAYSDFSADSARQKARAALAKAKEVA